MNPAGLSLEWIPAALLWWFMGTDVPLAFVEIEIQHIFQGSYETICKSKILPVFTLDCEIHC